jgi:hypothetical protein
MDNFIWARSQDRMADGNDPPAVEMSLFYHERRV